MGPTWVLSALDGPHVGPMNLVIRACIDVGEMDHLWFSKCLVALGAKPLPKLNNLMKYYQLDRMEQASLKTESNMNIFFE